MATEQSPVLLLVISVQDLVSFGMVLDFRTCIAKIRALFIKNILFREQDGRKSPLRDYGVTKVSLCIRPKGTQCLRGKSLASV